MILRSYSLIILLSLLIYLSCSLLPPTEQNFHVYLDDMYDERVPLVYASDLKDSLYRNYLFLDTRAKQEYQISHLPHAEWVGYMNFQKEKLKDIPKNQPIVVYCSVGYRSERIGEKLQNMGFEEIYNLYGGIFEWNNQGLLILNQNEKPTDSIHTYNKKWSKWVFRGKKVY